ncbi:iron(III) transport system permease protein [Alkaliphilus hydrothermalis]|uniref:Iron(III) transport system permease protein n=1 Tax=Alkaliphilus hydrothermalis TaxID=1482730 RepID=A0ABS2NNC8_9FIRM|nr:iron(III) transport system permease protein [Alkaliphilus hydrothermalis]
MLSLRKLKLEFNGWAVLSLLIILLIILPNINILSNVFKEANDNWVHIKTYLLEEYVINTLVILLFTGAFSLIIGTSLAWLVSVYDFPLRGFFRWTLILPLAIPPYIAAYTYTGLINYTGVIQTFLRNFFDLKINQKYANIMTIEGSIFIFTMFLFPYVYTITRAFIEKQSASLIETSRVLGRKPLEIFWVVVLPISRAAIIGSTTLVLLEVLNDYGVVQYFNIPTFSTAIFRTWFAFGDVNTAIKLAGLLMIVVVSILFLEHLLRGRKKFAYTTTKVRPIKRIKLKGLKAALAFGYSFSVLSIGFLIPTLQLLYWAFLTYKKIFNSKFLILMLNSISLALISSIIIIMLALIVANYTRISKSILGRICAKLTILGYSIPGAVIAIGVVVMFIALDSQLLWLYRLFNTDSKLVLSTSIAMLCAAYIIRYLGIGFNSVETGFEKVGKTFFEASRTLGMTITETFFKVDIKMIGPAILSGFILVFVDIMKELPLTLILRPFNFHTLATQAYKYASDENIYEAAIPSLIIILISFTSILIFHRLVDKEGEDNGHRN